MNKKRQFGLFLSLVGILIILGSVSGITGNVISNVSIEKSLSTIIGLILIIGGLVLFEVESLETVVSQIPIQKDEGKFVGILNKIIPDKVKENIKILIDSSAIKYIHTEKLKNPEKVERIESFFGPYDSEITPAVYGEVTRLNYRSQPLVPRSIFKEFIKSGTKIYPNDERMLQETDYNLNKEYEKLILDYWKTTSKGGKENLERFKKCADLELLKIALYRALNGDSTIILTTDSEIKETSEKLNENVLNSTKKGRIVVMPPQLLV